MKPIVRYAEAEMSDAFPIWNGLKQGDALPPLLFNFALECTMKKVLENQEVMDLNETHQILAYVDDVSILGENINTVKNKEALLEGCTEVSL
jgi:hypothetical protein